MFFRKLLKDNDIQSKDAKTLGRYWVLLTTKTITPKVVVIPGKTLARKAAPQLVNLGADGAKTLKRLSPDGVRKLTAVSGDLAKSPYRNEWLDVIAKYGDSAADFLWKRKGSIAVGVGASVVLLQPAEFLKTTGRVAETTIQTGTTQLVKPVVVRMTKEAVAPVAKEVGTRAGASFPWRLFWCTTFAGLTAVGILYYRKRKSMA